MTTRQVVSWTIATSWYIMQWFAWYGSWSEEYLIFAICYAKNGNFQIDLEVRGGPGEFFHVQVLIPPGLIRVKGNREGREEEQS